MAGKLHFARLSLYRCGQGQVARVLRGLPHVHPRGSYPFISFGPFDVVVLSPGAGQGGITDLPPLPGTGERRTLTCWADHHFRTDQGPLSELRLEDLLQYRSQDPDAWNGDLLPCWAFVHLRLAPLIQLARPKERSRLDQIREVVRRIGTAPHFHSGESQILIRYAALPLVDGQHLILLVRARDIALLAEFAAWLRSLRAEAQNPLPPAQANSIVSDHPGDAPTDSEPHSELLCATRWADLAQGTSEHPSAALFADSASFCAFPVQVPPQHGVENDPELDPSQAIRWVARMRDWAQTPIADALTLVTTFHFPPTARQAGLQTLGEFRALGGSLPFLLGPNQAVVEERLSTAGEAKLGDLARALVKRLFPSKRFSGQSQVHLWTELRLQRFPPNISIHPPEQDTDQPTFCASLCAAAESIHPANEYATEDFPQLLRYLPGLLQSLGFSGHYVHRLRTILAQIAEALPSDPLSCSVPLSLLLDLRDRAKILSRARPGPSTGPEYDWLTGAGAEGWLRPLETYILQNPPRTGGSLSGPSQGVAHHRGPHPWMDVVIGAFRAQAAGWLVGVNGRERTVILNSGEVPLAVAHSLGERSAILRSSGLVEDPWDLFFGPAIGNLLLRNPWPGPADPADSRWLAFVDSWQHLDTLLHRAPNPGTGILFSTLKATSQRLERLAGSRGDLAELLSTLVIRQSQLLLGGWLLFPQDIEGNCVERRQHLWAAIGPLLVRGVRALEAGRLLGINAISIGFLGLALEEADVEIEQQPAPSENWAQVTKRMLDLALRDQLDQLGRPSNELSSRIARLAADLNVPAGAAAGSLFQVIRLLEPLIGGPDYPEKRRANDGSSKEVLEITKAWLLLLRALRDLVLAEKSTQNQCHRPPATCEAAQHRLLKHIYSSRQLPWAPFQAPNTSIAAPQDSFLSLSGGGLLLSNTHPLGHRWLSLQMWMEEEGLLSAFASYGIQDGWETIAELLARLPSSPPITVD